MGAPPFNFYELDCLKMMQCLFRLLFVWMAFSCSISSLQAVEESPLKTLSVGSISVKWMRSDASLQKESVVARLKTKEGEPFSHLDFDQDIKLLAGEYDRVEPTLDIKEQKVFITLYIWPKPFIRSVQWKGLEQMKEKRLQKELGIHPGNFFDKQSFIKAFGKVRAYYVKKGFFEAELNYRLEPVENKNAVDVLIDVKEGRSGRISKILFKNFTSEEESECIDLMMTKHWKPLLSLFGEDGIYKKELAQHDQLVIINYLQNQGYADAKVDIQILPAKNEKEIYLEITADKGDIYQLGKISIVGNTLFQTSDLEKRLNLQEGERYSPEKLRNGIQAINDFYGRRGYIDALITYDLKLAEDRPVYSLQVKIEEGEKFMVGLIRVFGNQRTQASVILHECLLIPGDVFDQEKMRKTEEKLMMIGYFSKVNVYPVNASKERSRNFRDVHIEVEETETGNFMVFAGFSNSEKVFGGLKMMEKNFNYRGLATFLDDGMMALRGNGEYLNLSATIGQRGNEYVLSWAKPFFNDTQWMVGFDLERGSGRYYSQGDYEVRYIGGRIHASYPINQFVRSRSHLRVKSSTTHTVFKEDKKKDEYPPNINLDDDLKGLIHRHGALAGLGWGLLYDSRDNPYEPRSGFMSSLDAEIVGPVGKYKFANFQYLNSYYQPIVGNHVLKMRFDARFVIPYGNTSFKEIPLDERYFLGGEGSVRGFSSGHIGNRFIGDISHYKYTIPTPPPPAAPGAYLPAVPMDQGPKGGISSVLLSMEYDWKLTSRVHFFSFLDGGALSDKALTVGSMRWSVGGGARFRVFQSAPPLTFGLGYPLKKKDGDQKETFFFSIGGAF
jgi:outer membrane protein insertion porin family